MYIEDRDDESIPKKGKTIASFSEVLEALDSLDGDRRSLLLVAEGGPDLESGYPYTGMAMEIAGGPMGYTCVVYTPNCEEVLALSSDCDSKDDYKTICRPYPDQIPSDQIFHIDTIVEVLKIFVESGTINPKQKWIKY